MISLKEGSYFYMDNELIKTENIKNLIYTVRGKQVMLDNDVAELYKYETKFINLTVKRNQKRFPKEFCFQLHQKEFANLRLQFATSSLNNKDTYGGRRTLPYVFTEQRNCYAFRFAKK